MTKEELREDKVVTAVLEMKDSIMKNAVAITTVVVLVIAALVVVQVVRTGRARAEREASLLVFDGETVYRSGGAAEALPRFLEAAERFGGSPTGKMALLRAGDCQLEIGGFEDARASYERFLDSNQAEGFLRASGLRGLASVFDSMGRFDEAAAKFEEAANVVGSPLRPDDLVRAGRAWIDAGRFDEAIAAYSRVMEEFPAHAKVREAREGLAEAKELASTPR